MVFYGKGSGGKILGQKNDHCRPTIGDVALSNSKHNWTNYNQLAPQLKFVLMDSANSGHVRFHLLILEVHKIQVFACISIVFLPFFFFLGRTSFSRFKNEPGMLSRREGGRCCHGCPPHQTHRSTRRRAD